MARRNLHVGGLPNNVLITELSGRDVVGAAQHSHSWPYRPNHMGSNITYTSSRAAIATAVNQFGPLVRNGLVWIERMQPPRSGPRTMINPATGQIVELSRGQSNGHPRRGELSIRQLKAQGFVHRTRAFASVWRIWIWDDSNGAL